MALRVLQPGMKTGALAGGSARVSGVRLRNWSSVCPTYEARTRYSPVSRDWRSSKTIAPPGEQVFGVDSQAGANPGGKAKRMH